MPRKYGPLSPEHKRKIGESIRASRPAKMGYRDRVALALVRLEAFRDEMPEQVYAAIKSALEG